MNFFKQKAYMIICQVIMFVAIGLVLCSCSNNTRSRSSNHVWLWSRQTNYTVSTGAVSSVVENTWIRYRSETDFEHRSSDGQSFNRSGQTLIWTRVVENQTIIQTVVYHSTSGLIQSLTINAHGTISRINYTIVRQSDVGGVRTYRHFITDTGGIGAHSIHVIQNGRTLETRNFSATNALTTISRHTHTATSTVTRNYNANNVLTTMTTSFAPDNEIIRRKLPSFRLHNMEHHAIPNANTTQTVEVLSDSASELVLRIRHFNSSNVLFAQTDLTYIRFNRRG